jgi:hypothetical protein
LLRIVPKQLTRTITHQQSQIPSARFQTFKRFTFQRFNAPVFNLQFSIFNLEPLTPLTIPPLRDIFSSIINRPSV